MSKQVLQDKQFMKIYYPSTANNSSVHTDAARAAAVGAVTGAMGNTARCGVNLLV